MSSFLCNALIFVLSGLILFHFDKNHFSSSGFTEGDDFEVKLHPHEPISESWLPVILRTTD